MKYTRNQLIGIIVFSVVLVFCLAIFFNVGQRTLFYQCGGIDFLSIQEPELLNLECMFIGGYSINQEELFVKENQILIKDICNGLNKESNASVMVIMIEPDYMCGFGFKGV